MAVALKPGFMLVHGNRAEALRDVLVSWMRAQPLAPLENECMLVHSNGIAQWLRLALADPEHGCGVAAGLDFLLPSRFLWQAYRAVLGDALIPEQSPLDKQSLVWRLLRLLPEVVTEAPFEPLAGFLRQDSDGQKTYQLALKLADLFDQYQVYRADWLAAWAAGDDHLPDGFGRTRPLPDNQCWQAQLWRILQADLGARDVPVGRAAVHAAFMARVHAADTSGLDAMDLSERPPGLPRRILVFGVSSMPQQTLEALDGLSRWVQILMCVHNPCAHYWADIQGETGLLRRRFRRQARRPGLPEGLDGDALHAHTNPLLAAWGRQGRDFIALLDDVDDPAARAAHADALAGVHQRLDFFEALAGDCLLSQVQDDIRDLRSLAESKVRWPAIQPDRDQSIRFHIAHSPQREVEILQDQLLQAFADDASLQPRDIIVMVPDIEAYAPHVQAAFGRYEPNDKRYIPTRLADRGQRQSDPLVIVFEQLLKLPTSRLGAQTLIEWLDVPAVRARFEIGVEDLPLLQTWIQGAYVRWGLDAAHKAQFDLRQAADAAHQYTWDFGLQAMLLGYAGGPDADWASVGAYDEPSGLQAALLGALVRLLDTVARWCENLAVARSPAQWEVVLRELMDAFFEPREDADLHTIARLRQILQDWVQDCDLAGMTADLPLNIVAEHCLGALDQAGLSQRFFGGAVTFATLMPMRAIPFRHVCLLGMEDGAFPRSRVPMDFDLMVGQARPGDRSRREDDRYLFLEALLSARDRLYVSWVGRSILDDQALPPSVLVAQLREYLDRGWQCAAVGPEGQTLRPSVALTCTHRLQPFSTDYFLPVPGQNASTAPASSDLFTYAAEWRALWPADVGVASFDAPCSQTPTHPLEQNLADQTEQDSTERADQGLASPSDEPAQYESRPGPAGQFAHPAPPAGRWPGSTPLAPMVPPPVLRLSDLQTFLKYPVRAFFQRRLGVYFDESELDAPEDEPYRPDGLGQWQLRDALFAAAARADDATSLQREIDACLAGMRIRGALVAGALGDSMAERLQRSLDKPFERYLLLCEEWPQRLDQPVSLDDVVEPNPGDRCPFSDLLRGLRCNAQGDYCLISWSASDAVKSKQAYHVRALIGAWVTHVAAHATGHRLTSWVLSPKGQVCFSPMSAESARAQWQTWWPAWGAGMCQPLPVEIGTAYAWLRRGPHTPQDAVLADALSKTYVDALRRDLFLQRAYPEIADLIAHPQAFVWAETLDKSLDAGLHADLVTEKA